MKKVLLVALSLFVAGPLLAQDRLQLKSGQTVEGKLIAQDETSVRMEVAGIPLTYWMDDVEFLETQDGTRVTPAAQEEPVPEAPKGLQADWGTVEPEPVPVPPSPFPAAEETIEAPPPDGQAVTPPEEEILSYNWSQQPSD